ncbi:MAG: glycosyltransferase [Cellulosilyticaceae bacterium]
MKIALLTMFNGLSTTYSLVNVVKEQLVMLLSIEEISVKCLVSEDCPDTDRTGIFSDPRIEWVKITNRLNGNFIHWHDYQHASTPIHDTFFQEASTIAKDFITYLKDVDFCLLHDILYQGWHLVHNIALRQALPELPKTHFLSFTHSFPVTPPEELIWPFSARFMALPRTLYIYPTVAGLPALAHQYQVPLTHCYAVPNSLDTLQSFSEETRTIATKVDLLSPDFLIIYPARMTPAKQFENLAALAGAFKKVSKQSVKVIFCDFPCIDVSPSVYKGLIRKHGTFFGLDEADMVFTTDIGFKNGVSHTTVLELFTLSNLFICPSFSESFGLTLLEAASRGNFLVVNETVPALRELGTKLHAYFMKWDGLDFGFVTHQHYHPSESDYYLDHSKLIMEQMEQNPCLYAKTLTRKTYNPHTVFKTKLLPLLNTSIFAD